MYRLIYLPESDVIVGLTFKVKEAISQFTKMGCTITPKSISEIIFRVKLW